MRFSYNNHNQLKDEEEYIENPNYQQSENYKEQLNRQNSDLSQFDCGGFRESIMSYENIEKFPQPDMLEQEIEHERFGINVTSTGNQNEVLIEQPLQKTLNRFDSMEDDIEPLKINQNYMSINKPSIRKTLKSGGDVNYRQATDKMKPSVNNKQNPDGKGIIIKPQNSNTGYENQFIKANNKNVKQKPIKKEPVREIKGLPVQSNMDDYRYFKNPEFDNTEDYLLIEENTEKVKNDIVFAEKQDLSITNIEIVQEDSNESLKKFKGRQSNNNFQAETGNQIHIQKSWSTAQESHLQDKSLTSADRLRKIGLSNVAENTIKVDKFYNAENYNKINPINIQQKHSNNQVADENEELILHYINQKNVKNTNYPCNEIISPQQNKKKVTILADPSINISVEPKIQPEERNFFNRDNSQKIYFNNTQQPAKIIPRSSVSRKSSSHLSSQNENLTMYNDKITNLNNHFDNQGHLIEGYKYIEKRGVHHADDLPIYGQSSKDYYNDVPQKNSKNKYSCTEKNSVYYKQSVKSSKQGGISQYSASKKNNQNFETESKYIERHNRLKLQKEGNSAKKLLSGTRKASNSVINLIKHNISEKGPQMTREEYSQASTRNYLDQDGQSVAQRTNDMLHFDNFNHRDLKYNNVQDFYRKTYNPIQSRNIGAARPNDPNEYYHHEDPEKIVQDRAEYRRSIKNKDNSQDGTISSKYSEGRNNKFRDFNGSEALDYHEKAYCYNETKEKYINNEDNAMRYFHSKERIFGQKPHEQPCESNRFDYDDRVSYRSRQSVTKSRKSHRSVSKKSKRSISDDIPRQSYQEGYVHGQKNVRQLGRFESDFDTDINIYERNDNNNLQKGYYEKNFETQTPKKSLKEISGKKPASNMRNSQNSHRGLQDSNSKSLGNLYSLGYSGKKKHLDGEIFQNRRQTPAFGDNMMLNRPSHSPARTMLHFKAKNFTQKIHNPDEKVPKNIGNKQGNNIKSARNLYMEGMQSSRALFSEKNVEKAKTPRKNADPATKSISQQKQIESKIKHYQETRNKTSRSKIN